MKRVVLVCVGIAFLLPFSSSHSLKAQRKDFVGQSEILLMVGGMNYIGDLNNQSALSMPRLAGGVGIRYRIDNRWVLRGEINYGVVEQEKDYNKLRNLSFRSNIFELSFLGEFNFAPFGIGATEKRWTPYLFGGLGVFHFNPKAAYTIGNGEVVWAELQPLCTEGQASIAYSGRKQYPLTQLCMPFGVGIKWYLGKSFTLAVEYGFRKTWTDYLDDVSKTYVGKDFLQENSSDGTLAAQLADRSGEVVAGYVNAPGTKRGDDSLDDWYVYFHVSLGISFETMFGWMRSKRCRN